MEKNAGTYSPIQLAEIERFKEIDQKLKEEGAKDSLAKEAMPLLFR